MDTTQTIRVDAMDALKNMTLQVRITGENRLKERLYLAQRLIAMAGELIGASHVDVQLVSAFPEVTGRVSP
jgi:hypothetical protein